MVVTLDAPDPPFAGKKVSLDPFLTMAALYQLSYVGTDRHRIAATAHVTGSPGTPWQTLLHGTKPGCGTDGACYLSQQEEAGVVAHATDALADRAGWWSARCRI
jgi:hypothetical protein